MNIVCLKENPSMKNHQLKGVQIKYLMKQQL
ncbi:uncharacterized protein METZ01_LOCUS104132 [marine metagenome]|uniref:Uncharacterized protein n=1 Tax=marine metagenome TaxID=408172 RepID=A0A381WGR9_9ZZZZ